jgi:1-aminocyclopropane-1-carboxylate deaminase
MSNFERCEDRKQSIAKNMIHLSEPILLNNVSLPLSSGGRASFTIARLDRIHPIVSGNKLFKLYRNLQRCTAEQKTGIITMGGAYSNHLAATSYACNQLNLKSIALVRGEINDPLNHTLSFCKANGMELIAVKRSEFYQTSTTIVELLKEHAGYLFVPEGGANEDGVKGCREILSQIPGSENFTHIVCAVGTGTTCRGIADTALPHQTVIAVPVIRVQKNVQESFTNRQLQSGKASQLKVLFDFAGKGYAKADTDLFEFMNRFYRQTSVPLDFVYTAKLLQAVIHLFESGYFETRSRVLVMHSGGLQGNDSLPANTLVY